MNCKVAPLKILSVLLGKRLDVSWQSDPMFDLAARRFVENIRALQSGHVANRLSLASDLVYESNYQLDWWQKLFFPVLSWRLVRLQLLARQEGFVDCSTQAELRLTVAHLEFGDKVPPVHFVPIIRRDILEHELSNWSVRQAFNSKALKKTSSALQIRRQPEWVYRIATIAHWIFGIASAVLLIAFVNDALAARPIQDALHINTLVIDACMIFTALFYQLGAQWKNGDHVMANIWPSATVQL